MRGRTPGFRQVLRVGEFRALWAAELLSIVGDQLAGVALAVLVFQSTSSAALTALTYALTFVPSVLGGALLSGLADRYPRRQVLVVTDLIRAGLAGLMAVPGVPLPVLWLLIGLLSLSAGPFKAAQLALLPQVLTGASYLVGLSLRQVTNQAAQLIGFASAGLLLVAVPPHVALGANSATFVISAVVILLGVRRRPGGVATTTGEPAGASATRLPRSRQLTAMVALVLVAGLFVVPEGVAAPYGSALGVGSIGIGLLMAADPLGSVVGAWLVARVRIQPARLPIVALAAGSGVPLVLCAPGPGLLISIVLWAASGAMSTAYLILIQAAVVDLVPDRHRGRVMGRIATGLYASQGMAIVAGGVAAQAVGPYRAIAGAGLLGLVLALCVGQWWRPVARSRCDLATGSGQTAGGKQSPVLVRHPKHLPENIAGSDFEFVSPVLVRHRTHLLTNTHGHDNQPRSPILVRHRPHLLANTEGHNSEPTSPVLVRHRTHLLTNTHGHDKQPTSPVLVRHRKHLLPKPANVPTTEKTTGVQAMELSLGTRASLLCASIAGAVRSRFAVGWPA